MADQGRGSWLQQAVQWIAGKLERLVPSREAAPTEPEHHHRVDLDDATVRRILNLDPKQESRQPADPPDAIKSAAETARQLDAPPPAEPPDQSQQAVALQGARQAVSPEHAPEVLSYLKAMRKEAKAQQEKAFDSWLVDDDAIGTTPTNFFATKHQRKRILQASRQARQQHRSGQGIQLSEAQLQSLHAVAARSEGLPAPDPKWFVQAASLGAAASITAPTPAPVSAAHAAASAAAAASIDQRGSAPPSATETAAREAQAASPGPPGGGQGGGSPPTVTTTGGSSDDDDWKPQSWRKLYRDYRDIGGSVLGSAIGASFEYGYQRLPERSPRDQQPTDVPPQQSWRQHYRDQRQSRAGVLGSAYAATKAVVRQWAQPRARDPEHDPLASAEQNARQVDRWNVRPGQHVLQAKASEALQDASLRQQVADEVRRIQDRTPDAPQVSEQTRQQLTSAADPASEWYATSRLGYRPGDSRSHDPKRRKDQSDLEARWEDVLPGYDPKAPTQEHQQQIARAQATRDRLADDAFLPTTDRERDLQSAYRATRKRGRAPTAADVALWGQRIDAGAPPVVAEWAEEQERQRPWGDRMWDRAGDALRQSPVAGRLMQQFDRMQETFGDMGPTMAEQHPWLAKKLFGQRGTVGGEDKPIGGLLGQVSGSAGTKLAGGIALTEGIQFAGRRAAAAAAEGAAPFVGDTNAGIAGEAGQSMANVAGGVAAIATGGPLGVAYGAVEIGKEVVKLPGLLNKWAESLLDSAEKIKEFNAVLANTFARAEYRTLQRQFRSGQVIAGSISNLSETYQNFQDTVQPLKDAGTNWMAGEINQALRTLTVIADLLRGFSQFLGLTKSDEELKGMTPFQDTVRGLQAGGYVDEAGNVVNLQGNMRVPGMAGLPRGFGAGADPAGRAADPLTRAAQMSDEEWTAHWNDRTAGWEREDQSRYAGRDKIRADIAARQEEATNTGDREAGEKADRDLKERQAAWERQDKETRRRRAAEREDANRARNHMRQGMLDPQGRMPNPQPGMPRLQQPGRRTVPHVRGQTVDDQGPPDWTDVAQYIASYSFPMVPGARRMINRAFDAGRRMLSDDHDTPPPAQRAPKG